MTFPLPQSTEAIRRAHDLLFAGFFGAHPLAREEAESAYLEGSLDALCWVLGCTHNGTFEAKLAELREREDASA